MGMVDMTFIFGGGLQESNDFAEEPKRKEGYEMKSLWVKHSPYLTF